MTEAVNRNRLVVLALGLAVGVLAIVALLTGPQAAQAASHREAPLISLDPTADITDFFMFRSYEPGNADKVVMIMDVIPGEEPSSGPNYWNFDPNVLYKFSVDNNRDGRADDVEFELRFRNEIRGAPAALGLPLSYVGCAPPAPGPDCTSTLPPITALDGAGSEGLGLRQRYSLTMLHHNHRTRLAQGLIAVPSNVGPRTMPDYDALAAQGVNTLAGGIKVFAGQREDPFYIDLGGVFDTLNLRRFVPGESAGEDADDTTNPYGIDMLSGFNVHSIALEMPASILSGDTGTNVLGAYASTSRPHVTVGGEGHGQFEQVQRLANPLVNEAIIGTPDKDEWNALEPQQERRFEDYYLNPRLALALQVVYGIPAALHDRTDLRDLLLKYQPGDRQLSELLRLDLGVPPTPLADQHRLTVLAGDPAGWPNGRRPKDDVTDLAIRVVGGANYIAARAADGVNTDDATLPSSFPFLATPFDGRNRHHDNP
ncbi:MAG TPA: DUF4331 domain-containing protein [Gaiellaceae bacterium]|nr:DUF4331 domain-containing protein [Gaiellaceae bacterium]